MNDKTANQQNKNPSYGREGKLEALGMEHEAEYEIRFTFHASRGVVTMQQARERVRRNDVIRFPA